jgi:uncharacterized damage-inducible protein DinB
MSLCRPFMSLSCTLDNGRMAGSATLTASETLALASAAKNLGVTETERTSPPKAAGELATLCGFLDFLREAIALKATGLEEESLRRPIVPSGVSLLGIVKHMVYVERLWMRRVFSGEDIEFPWSGEDPDADWRPGPDESSAVLLSLYQDECARSREIIAAATPDQLAARPWHRTGERVSLRGIVAHLIEETGRHAGHADILRELIDGQTGE